MRDGFTRRRGDAEQGFTHLPTLAGREELVERNSNLALTESIAEIAGPGLAGVLVQLMTAPMAILFDAVSFFCSARAISSARSRQNA